MHTNSKPKSILVNTLKIKKEKTEVLNEKALSNYENLSYSWDEKQGIIYVKLPDTGLDLHIEINSSK